MPNKSDCKAVFQELLLKNKTRDNGKSTTFNAAGFCVSDTVPACETPDAVLIDGSVVLRRVASVLEKPGPLSNAPISDIEIASMLTRPAMIWAHNSTARTVVLVFDKPSHVPVAKVPEQRKRDSAAERCRQKQGVLPLPGAGTRRHWGISLGNRNTRPEYLARLMNAVRHNALSPAWYLPSGVRVIIDCEPGVPFQLPGGARCEELRNQVGEFDNALGFWVRALDRPPHVLLDTIDTDLMFVAALYEVHEDSPVSVTVQFTATKKQQSLHTYVSARRLVTAIQRCAHIPGRDRANKVDVLIGSSVLAGSDFTSGVRGVGHASILRALTQLSPEPRPFTDIARQTIDAALQARFKRSFSSHRPAKEHVQGELARTKWALSYWRSHLSGDASPRYPCPKGYGWALCESACFPWSVGADNVVIQEHARFIVGPCAATMCFKQLVRGLQKRTNPLPHCAMVAIKLHAFSC